MHAGPPDANYSDLYSADLAERLGRLVSTVDEAGRAQVDRGRALVIALTDQLAAGQSETLYSLQTAANAVRDRGRELERLAEQMPEEIAGQLRDLVALVVEGLSRDVGLLREGISRELAAQQDDYLSVLRESARATGGQLSTELEHAATTVVESAARAKASQTAVRAAAVAAVESLESAAASFTTHAEGAIQAMQAVGESFVSRLFQVLDERDQREQELEELLSARMEQITAHAERRLQALTAAVDAQLRRLEERDLTERQTTTAELHTLLDRLLAEPRGRLRELRGSRSAAPPVRVNPQPLRAEPVYREVYEEPEARPTRKAPAKKATDARAPAKKKAPAKKSTTPRKTATKNEDT